MPLSQAQCVEYDNHMNSLHNHMHSLENEHANEQTQNSKHKESLGIINKSQRYKVLFVRTRVFKLVVRKRDKYFVHVLPT
jgi:hypothetical protein